MVWRERSMERREWHCVEDAEVLVQHPAVCVILIVFYFFLRKKVIKTIQHLLKHR